MDFADKNGCGGRRWGLTMAFLLLLLLSFLDVSWGRRRGSRSRQELDIKSHLRSLNKRAVKSIKSRDGDIIDCVPVPHQPAFDHPLIKNHTIQCRPNFHPEGLNFKESKIPSRSKPVTQLWHLNGRCPKGSIPIRRTTMRDVSRSRSSVKSYGRKKTQSISRPNSADLDLADHSGHQHAIVYVEGDKLYGAKATVNVWSPSIQQHNEFSLSQIWVLGGSFGEDLNSIEAGWQVSPDLYGDNNTRLFTYWTSDAYQSLAATISSAQVLFRSATKSPWGQASILSLPTAVLNTILAFLSGRVFVAQLFADTSDELVNFHPLEIPAVRLMAELWQDPKEGNWWMQFGDGHVLGYWPAFLFSYLANSASMIQWGGEVVNSESGGRHTATEMGSGHFPEEGFSKAGYFRNIQYVDGFNNLRIPRDIGTFTEQPSCYDVQTGESDDWGSYFFYGGPGRNPNCP